MTRIKMVVRLVLVNSLETLLTPNGMSMGGEDSEVVLVGLQDKYRYEVQMKF